MKIVVLFVLVASCLAEMEAPATSPDLTRVAMDVVTDSEDTMLKAEAKMPEEITEPEKLRIYIVPNLQRTRIPHRPPMVPLPLSRFHTPYMAGQYQRPYHQPLVVPANPSLVRTHVPSKEAAPEELVMEHPLARVVYLTSPTYSPHYVYDPFQGQVTESQYFIDKNSCLTTPLASFCLKKPVLNL